MSSLCTKCSKPLAAGADNAEPQWDVDEVRKFLRVFYGENLLIGRRQYVWGEDADLEEPAVRTIEGGGPQREGRRMGGHRGLFNFGYGPLTVILIVVLVGLAFGSGKTKKKSSVHSL